VSTNQPPARGRQNGFGIAFRPRGRVQLSEMIELSPSQKGAVAEAAITTAAMELGLTVLRPLCEGRRYDIVIDLEPRLLRVQCKLARELDSVLLVTTHTNRCTPRGYISTQYTPDEVDAVAAYAPKARRCYLLPIDEVTSHRGVHLRLAPAKNKQAQGIRWARDYEFEASLRRYWRAPRNDVAASGLARPIAIP
jgi:hypothetical protein